ncbi:ROK family transcriptional regulator [Actinacidiphila oryziradicis]|uniref:ROK family transcriptional regulator n=1 Tax=Actinacidiphila oryziradicis TaxID=2571141 RepID=A0A4U0SRT5_9ACTN|nr:ROK family transcriptional regulator [Actinacidiphila oryziradicis]TKA12128.1 ROK family transcriptional regulator [Actinacidiphila oryziradicis]
MTATTDVHSGHPLSDSARAVFAVLAAAGSATRPQLAAQSGLSKPTVSSVMTELEAAGLAARSGTAHGGTGRSAAVYRLGPASGSVLAIDLGSTHTEVRGIALDGTVLAVQRTDDDLRPAEAVHAVLGRLPVPGPLRAVVVAVPDVAARQESGGTRPATSRIAVAFEALELPPGVPVHVENNVNCAALAELHDGAARDRHSFAYLQVGYNIGLGIVYGGQVLRGANGAAGEVARLPYPWAEGLRAEHEGLEAYAGARSLVRRAAYAWRPADGDRPETAERLFALAADGHLTARRMVTEHAGEVGRLAAAVTAVLDPGLIVLGGGIGANPQLLPGVNAELERLSWPTKVVCSVLGNSGTVVGATRLAVARGVQNVIGGDQPGIDSAP